MYIVGRSIHIQLQEDYQYIYSSGTVAEVVVARGRSGTGRSSIVAQVVLAKVAMAWCRGLRWWRYSQSQLRFEKRRDALNSDSEYSFVSHERERLKVKAWRDQTFRFKVLLLFSSHKIKKCIIFFYIKKLLYIY